jgi:hypothetical protein
MNVKPTPGRRAYGEMLGLVLPTRYPEETHKLITQAMVADSSITPVLTRMSRPVVLICWGLAALLTMTGTKEGNFELKTRLQLELATGFGLICIALLNIPRVRFLERLYLLFGGVMMVANALMTEVD